MTQYEGLPPLRLPASQSATPQQFSVGERRRGTRLLLIATLVVAIVAAVMAGSALMRQRSSSSQSATTATPPSSGAYVPNAVEIAAAKKTACDAWSAASTAMLATRQPFLDAPPNWNDPANMSGLAQAQAGILTQVEYLRQHLSPATPADVAGPIRDFIVANVDLIAADGQHQSAAVANTAAEHSIAAAAKIRTTCGG
jgi:predicted membrane-bound mannosyltransferase